ncbi:MAG: 50S ribosomal protein L23 [Gemmatimonadota bacterium]
MSRAPQEILIRPVFTEESSRLQFDPGRVRARHRDKERPKHEKFVFEVARDATKVDIRRAIEELYDVRVRSVRTMNCLGKARRVRRQPGRRPHWKKAIVTLAEGDTLDMFGGL